MDEPIEVGKPSGPEYATFICKDYQEDCRRFQETGIESHDVERFHDGCTEPYVNDLPPFWMDLLPCPYCGGPSELLELLAPVAG